MAQSREQQIHLPQLDRNGQKALLEMSTSKDDIRGGIMCIAMITFNDSQRKTFELCGDFRVTVFRDKTARATQKAIETLHSRCFSAEEVVKLQGQALAFYEEKHRAGKQ